MKSGTPKIDGRSAIEIFNQAIVLARKSFPEPSPGEPRKSPLWPNIHKDPTKRDDNDIGITLLRLFSRLAETVVRQLDRAPEKHQLAFFDFIGTGQLPPAASQAALTFMLAKGAKTPVTVPARTKVASKDDPKVVFETLEPLTVSNIQVSAAFSLNPWADTYSEHSTVVSGSDEGFHVFAGEKPVDHILYLMDDAFDNEGLASLEIAFSFANDASIVTEQWFRDLFAGCSDAKGNKLALVVRNVSKGTYSLVFKDRLPEKADNGEYWLAFSPKEGLLASGVSALPEITGGGITCTITTDEISPDAVYFNDNSIEIKKGFYPFGQTPRIGDAFYIACDKVFSKPGSTINVSFKLKGGTAFNGLAIVWEYWDGSGWNKATNVSDGSKAFTVSNSVTLSLVIPGDRPAVPTDLNGKKGYWIRARIDQGDFGGPGGFESSKSNEILSEINRVLKSKDTLQDTINAVNAGFTESKILVGVTYRQPSYAPPFIYSLSLGYEYKNKLVQRCRTSNNFQSEDQNPAKAFKPYTMLEMAPPALYVRLDGATAGCPCSLYFSMKVAEYGQTPPKISEAGYAGQDSQDKANVFNWSYYNGKQKAWVDLGVQDGTVHFTRNGIVTFLLPAEMANINLFGQEGCWVKISAGAGKWLEAPLVAAILPNTVWAENASFVKDEILGSSNGMPGQVFTMSAKPVLEGQVVEVKEPAVPSEDELRLIGSEEGESAVRITRTDSGDIKEVWVTWHEVNSFCSSGPLSRHYIIDRTGGRVIFGDGARGMIPPAVANNIAARLYKNGGGKNGDVQRGALTGMKTTIPNVEKVFNADSASGGRDLESADSLIRRTPYFLRTGGRAVTAGDFEMLAAESSPYVSRASCIAEEESGDVVVIIAPVYTGEKRSPEAALLDHVGAYLRERAYPPVSDLIRVIGPEYKTVTVDVEFKPVSISLGQLAANMVREKLRDYFHPITGGRDGTGWPFGCELFYSEIASVVEDVDGVDYITKLTIDGNEIGTPETAWMTKIADNMLPWAGDGDITVTPVNGEDA